MIGTNFKDVTDNPAKRFSDSPLGKLLENFSETPTGKYDSSLAKETENEAAADGNETKETRELTDEKTSSANDAADNAENKTSTPDNHGTWDGDRGNSTWHPDPDYVPPEKSRNPEEKPYSNPDKLSWKEILEKYGIDGIEFRDGFPVFDEISRGTVEIDDFETGGSDAKDRNFKRADIALAKQRGCTPGEVEQWRKENNYTWHECEDKRTMQKVPNEVHANVKHDGGRSQ